jgi:hypothetical protein
VHKWLTKRASNRINICRRRVFLRTARFLFTTSTAFTFESSTVHKYSYFSGAGSSSTTFSSITVARSRAHSSSVNW